MGQQPPADCLPQLRFSSEFPGSLIVRDDSQGMTFREVRGERKRVQEGRAHSWTECAKSCTLEICVGNVDFACNPQ